MILLLIEKIRLTGNAGFIPLLKVWKEIEYKKVQAEIQRVIDYLMKVPKQQLSFSDTIGYNNSEGIEIKMPESSSVYTRVKPAALPEEYKNDYIKRVTIDGLEPFSGEIVLEKYNPNWPAMFEREADKIRNALGDRALQVHHVGSTAVPGLCAKPLIDILLVVADSSNESAYIPALEAAGYTLRIRESDWFEHRMLKGSKPDVNLHVFSEGTSEIERMLAFRDLLRNNDDDRLKYEQAKRELARQTWSHVQHYADAKTAVIKEIIERAFREGNHEHGGIPAGILLSERKEKSK